MRTFLEWANQETDLFEMAVFHTPSGEGEWKIGSIQVKGPTVHSVLKGKGSMGIGAVVDGLLKGAKFRKAGSSEAYKSLEDLCKEQDKPVEEVRKWIIGKVKDQLRTSKGGWRKYVHGTDTWSLAPDADETLAKARAASAPGAGKGVPLFDDEEKKEDKKEEAPKAEPKKKSKKAAAPEAEKKEEEKKD